MTHLVIMFTTTILMFIAMLLPIAFAGGLLWFMAGGKKQEEATLQLQPYRNQDNFTPQNPTELE